MYEILVTGPLGTSECAGECRFSANLCKRALDVTAGVIIEATRKADILTINARPLDSYFFRQYKIYAKRITEFNKLRSSNMQPKLHDRVFNMKLHSVI